MPERMRMGNFLNSVETWFAIFPIAHRSDFVHVAVSHPVIPTRSRGLLTFGSPISQRLRRMRPVRSRLPLRREFFLTCCLVIVLARNASAQGPAPTPLFSPAPVLPATP